MKKKYRQLMDQNNELVIEHMKRYNNQQELLDGLKKVNQVHAPMSVRTSVSSRFNR